MSPMSTPTTSMNADQWYELTRSRLRAIRQRRRRGHLFMFDQQPSISPGVEPEGGGGGGGPDDDGGDGGGDDGGGGDTGGGNTEAFDAGNDGGSSDGGNDSGGGGGPGDDDDGDNDGGVSHPFDGQAGTPTVNFPDSILPMLQDSGGGSGAGGVSTSLAGMLGGLFGYGG